MADSHRINELEQENAELRAEVKLLRREIRMILNNLEGSGRELAGILAIIGKIA